MNITRTKERPRGAGADYLRLVRLFPLRVLRGDAEYEEAIRIHGRLVGRVEPKLTAGEREYADALACFIRDYDEPLTAASPTTPLERLRYLIEQSGTTPAQLREILGGSQPLVSLIVAGKRRLTVPHIRSLAAHFKLDAGYFI